MVNNVTQEISSDASNLELDGEAGEIVQNIGDSLHALASEVSDFRLMREFESLLELESQGHSYLQNFLHSVERYANALSRRYAVNLDVEVDEAGEDLVFEGEERSASE